MADNNNKSDENNEENYSNFRNRNEAEIQDDSMEESSPNVPDLGLGHSHRRNEPTTSDGVRREESASFSFKHFLQSSSTGARPKVYDNPNYPNYQHPKDYSSSRRQLVNTSELASVLPDFVQDHLVVEQCYLADSSTLNIEKFATSELPLDLGQRSDEQLPFDLTRSMSPDDLRSWNNRGGLPLDLAQSESLPLDLANNATSRLQNENLPCDLGLGQGPLDLGVGSCSNENNETVSTAQSLPDFLSDGPIQIGRENEGLPALPEQLTEQNREESLRRQLNEVTRRCEALESELRRCREAAHHREEALRRSNSELAALRRENVSLRSGDNQSDTGRTQRVARELMAAATHAELSLRQLLSGVESLRLLASTLDQGPPPPPSSPHSVPRHSPSTPHPDFDPEDRAGPAL